MIRSKAFVCIGTALASLACTLAVSGQAEAFDGAGLQHAFERAAYTLEDSGHGSLQGANPAQRLTLEFNGREARIGHPNGSVSFHLAGYGYGDRLRRPAAASPTGTGDRVEYRRGDLTEWYVNGSQGPEQGFTFARRPANDRTGKPLVIALGFTGRLLPAQNANGAVLFESNQGAVLRYAGLQALDARGRALPSRLEVRDREIRLIVEDRDAWYPLVVDPTWTQQAELVATGGTAQIYFGTSVAVSGDTAVVSGGGAAYVFVETKGVWKEQQKLTASEGALGAVSLSGDTAVIANPGYNFSQGAAYVFVRNGTVWSQQQVLTASDGEPDYDFANSVSVSGDTAVVGDSYLNGSQGAAYVFVRSGTTWTQQQKLTAAHAAAGNDFGSSVSVSGDRAIVGASGKNTYEGVAYVFARSGDTWSQQQELSASDGAAQAEFGESVSLSGDTTVIGARGATIDSNTFEGAAYVFVESDGKWSQQKKLTASDGGASFEFGYSVSVSGNTVVVGAVGAPTFYYQGYAYIFARTGTKWKQQKELTGSDSAAGDFFGNSVSVSGPTAVIGAQDHTVDGQEYEGAAYVFHHPKKK